MGSSGSSVGSWVRASQSLPPYGIRVPPWQDVAAHAAHTTAGHPWCCAMTGCQSFPVDTTDYQETLCETISENLCTYVVQGDTASPLLTCSPPQTHYGWCIN